MTPVEAIVLGIVQGLTEFLPVSSSGHLVLAESWLGLEPGEDVTFEVTVHLGTLFAIVAVFRRDLLALVATLPAFVRPLRWRERWSGDPAFRTAIFLIVATLPVVVVGLTLRRSVEALFGRPHLVPFALLATAALLLSTRSRGAGTGGLTAGRALVLGLAQSVALIPGISRSGSTISTGLLLGLDRELAGRFSFLMAVPAILGAVVLQIDEFRGSPDWTALSLGLLASFLSGLGALLVLMRLVRRGRLWVFAPYLVAVALLALATLP